MGQKVNPIIFRINNGNKKTWSSVWFSAKKKDYVKNLVEDLAIQNYFIKNSSKYSVGKVSIERMPNKPPRVSIASGKVSLVVGKKGEGVAVIESDLKGLIKKPLSIDVKEIRKTNLDANIVARAIADKIEKRQSFKRSAKSAIDLVMKSGAAGVKVICSGRLNGAEIARSETFKNGVIPLHTLRADIDYACQEAHTTYGIIGIRVWICIKR
jgi:small subunit ribosomal protein S3